MLQLPPHPLEILDVPVVEALSAERPPLRTQTSDWALDFVGTKLSDLDGSAVQNLTGGWVGRTMP
ncbi:hypothetical protein [Streptomyces sp. NPDC002520]